MSEQNQELELYKLVTKNEIECRWVSDTEFHMGSVLWNWRIYQ